MHYTIALIPGEGAESGVLEETLEVLDAVGDLFGHTFNYVELLPDDYGSGAESVGSEASAADEEDADDEDDEADGDDRSGDDEDIGSADEAGEGREAAESLPINGPDVADECDARFSPAADPRDPASPLASILGAASLLRNSFGLEKEAKAIEQAVAAAAASAKETKIDTTEMGRRVLEALTRQAGEQK